MENVESSTHHVYAGSIIAFRRCIDNSHPSTESLPCLVPSHRPLVIIATSLSEAVSVTKKTILEAYPISHGWIRHGISIVSAIDESKWVGKFNEAHEWEACETEEWPDEVS